MRPLGRRFGIVTALVVLLAPGAPRARATPADQASPGPAPFTLATDAEREAFLATARIVRTRSASKGVTATLRATLTNGTVTHDASIQTIDESRPVFEGPAGTELNFKDQWRYNVAAYRLDRLLGLGMIPVTVERRHRSKPASFTWWVDDVLMDEQEHYRQKRPTPDVADWNQQMWTTRVFDQLIANADRNLGNLLIDARWNVWMIDHSRAFRLNPAPKTPANLTRIERSLLDGLRRMDEASVRGAVADYLTAEEIAALLKRRDVIVRHFEQGGPALLFERRPRCC